MTNGYTCDEDFVNSPIHDELDFNQPQTELLKPFGIFLAILIAFAFTTALFFTKLTLKHFSDPNSHSGNYLIAAMLLSVLSLLCLVSVLIYGLMKFHRESLAMMMPMFISVYCLAFADLSLIIVVVFGFRSTDILLPLLLLMVSAASQRLLYETRRRGWIFLNQRNIRLLSSFTSVLLWWWILSANIAVLVSIGEILLDWIRIWIHYFVKRFRSY